jgi:hypothetical protein
MADRITTSGAAAGTAGAAYRKILTFSAKAAGNYIINDTNFPGIGVYLPCNAIVQLTPGAGGAALQVSNDNGTTWFAYTTSTSQFAVYTYLDTASTHRVVITTNPADVRLIVQ